LASLLWSRNENVTLKQQTRALFALFLLLSPSSVLLGQAPSELEELRRLVQAQREQIQLQQQQLAAIEKRLEALAAAPATPKPSAIAAAPATPPAPPPVAVAKVEAPVQRTWYQKYSFRGYTQIRNSRLFADNPNLSCEQCDRSIGSNNNLFIRRARFILYGDVSDRIYIYFQPDFASTSGGLNFGQIRDLYFDIALDKKKEFRIRAGQSKVPYGFEAMQSSQNRLALDRNDGINSANPNERELGMFFYWAPDAIRKRFAYLVNSGLKGSGDYGVFGAGVYNGQGANRPEANNNMHYVARLTYPFQFKNGQIFEAGVQRYRGRAAITSDQRTAGIRYLSNYADQRTAGSFVLYPQPFGIQGEFNVGTGPEFVPGTRSVENKRLRGGYIQTMYMKKVHGQVLTPYARFHYYSGGKKFELDARRYLVRETNVGLEWQPNPSLEVVSEYVHSDRTYEDGRLMNNRQKGNLLRLQLQINY
jgi:phosphate-selective porin